MCNPLMHKPLYKVKAIKSIEGFTGNSYLFIFFLNFIKIYIQITFVTNVDASIFI